MDRWFLFPPVTFIIIFGAAYAITSFLAKLSFKQNKPVEGTGESYACGESNYNHTAQPDYSSFFPFAFFFTLAHVAALIMATVPMETIKILAIVLIYLSAASLGLYILLRK